MEHRSIVSADRESTKSTTPLPATPSLSPCLAVVNSNEDILTVPQLPAEHMPIAEQALAEHEAAMTGGGREMAAAMVSKLAMVLPMRKTTEEEARFLVEAYAEQLKTIPYDIMLRTYKRLLDRHKWFPTIAEIKDSAAVDIGRRRYTIMRLKMLIRRGPAPEPVAYVDPQAAAAILEEFKLKRVGEGA